MTARQRVTALGVVALLGFAALGYAGCSPRTDDPTSPPGDPTAPPVPPSPVEGIVVAITSRGLGDVERFNLRLANGTVVVLHVGTLENPTEFPPGHLAEHQASSEPIRVYYRDESLGPVVYRLEDASDAPSS